MYIFISSASMKFSLIYTHLKIIYVLKVIPTVEPIGFKHADAFRMPIAKEMNNGYWAKSDSDNRTSRGEYLGVHVLHSTHSLGHQQIHEMHSNMENFLIYKRFRMMTNQYQSGQRLWIELDFGLN